MWLYLLSLLSFSLAKGLDTLTFSLNSIPEASVSVRVGQTASLPCWISPTTSAEDLEVRWYRPNHFDNPSLLYREKKVERSSSELVTFGLRDPKSTGLKEGDVSLKVRNVQIEDAGRYTCYVSSQSNYEDLSVYLNVTELGTVPLLSVVRGTDGRANVSCESEGWYPKPQLLWAAGSEVLTPGRLVITEDPSGLSSVSSWLLLPDSSSITCSVGLSEEDTSKARLRLEMPDSPGSSPAGWIAVIATLVVMNVLLILGILFLRYKMKKPTVEKEISKDLKAEEGCSELDQLLQPATASDLQEARRHKEDITLEKCPDSKTLKVNDVGKIVRDTSACNAEDDGKVTSSTSIEGRPGFSSGQHYWEVQLAQGGVEIKKLWWVGVCVQKDHPDGVWYLSSDSNGDIKAHLGPQSILLPFKCRPRVLGVYLNYDKGELSFYNIDEKRILVTLQTKFPEKVFPLFNPGRGDKSPLSLIITSSD